MSVLRLENLSKAYHGKLAVDSVSLQVEGGRVIGLLGPNGAGKTTTFYMAVGLISPDRGQIFLGDQDLTKEPMYKRARKGMGYLPQESSVFRKLTVFENIAAILEIRPLSQTTIEEKARGLMEELGISHLADRGAALLSGGERRRLEIARALATDPAFMLLDEPFAGIDPLAVQEIQDIIRVLAKKGIGVLISDHNVRETLGVCDTAHILNQGQVIESGCPETIARSKVARKIYLGESFTL